MDRPPENAICFEMAREIREAFRSPDGDDAAKLIIQRIVIAEGILKRGVVSGCASLPAWS